ncbi:hypothetical protein [Alcanivorax sp.]|jgi:hypothetical protein|uniref:hypothetical protein n=1 Tax=Alcanivorax sp. TaxID=1872427 RepID=UPI0025C71226|nr:hypothetical protein [Alcanivorax sp.]
MNEEQLAGTLQSVGQSCFVRFFGEFSSRSMSREDVIEKLRAETNYTEGSCISRTGHAQSIINAGLAKSALNIVISSESPRVTENTREEARQWLKNAE